MSGLRSRLEQIEGVSDIELELGEDGIEGITVRLQEGADEATVLDGVRRLLVAYGTRSPQVVDGFEQGPALSPTNHFIDLDDSDSGHRPQVTLVSSGQTEATVISPHGEEFSLSVTPGGNRSSSQIVFTSGRRIVRRQVPSSARAIVQGVIDAATELLEHEPISVVGLDVSAAGGSRVLTVITGSPAGAAAMVSTVSVVGRDWPAALLQMVADVVGSRQVATR